MRKKSSHHLELPNISPVRGRVRNKNESEVVITAETVAEGLAVFKSLRSHTKNKKLSVGS